jgi:hypothetical protein
MLACLPPITLVADKLQPPLDDTQHACCETYIAELMASGLAPTAPPAAEPVDPSLLNCCRALAYSSHWEVTPAHTVCCGARLLTGQDFNQPYCSPWGPPMPPALGLA